MVFLVCLILLTTAFRIQTHEVPHHMSMTVAELGDKVTLTCSMSSDETGLFYWYKLNLGRMVQTVAAGTFDKISLKEQFTNSRFTITKVSLQYRLTIRNVSKEDEATYFCQAGSAYIMKMINGTMLAVNDHKPRERSVYVRQSPEATSVQPGASVTLQCLLLCKNKENQCSQCAGEHSVYWFRAGSEGFNTSIIYTNSISKHEEEERTCVYSLSKTIQDSSDAGTYYCAVDTCGHILFGEGTRVETRQHPDPVVIVLGVLLALCGIVIAILIFSRD